MRLYITGADGSLGKALTQELSADPRTADWTVQGVSVTDFDIGDEAAVLASVESFRPDIVLHLAAISIVAPCETDPGLALRVNVSGVHQVAEACRRVGSRMVYISSDYVFDGAGAPEDGYRETDVPNPLSVYALTKLAGEQIAAHVPEHLVVRTSWLFGGAAENNDDVLATIRAAERGEQQKLIDDQYSRPTYTVDLARALIHLITLEEFPTGTVHAANEGRATRYELGAYALSQYDPKLNADHPPTAISFDECEFVGGRPKFSAFNTDRLAGLGFAMPDWRDAVNRHCAVLPRPATPERTM
ncbi:NAD(P)-dependent oxidoreductase [Streptomyces sp. Je 1-4]|uniref:SDR family oxidoreductase n=1 Tax=Streptomyces TaxID=1883 RepID=UPI00140F14E5|nr:MULTISPECIES: NAD(P)-dependent oxidoreductase [unclassified Streptomyces]QIK07386.1 NAD(P)-dependent oxidoreductase [Streptomyces sp. ID38640]UYB40852.1 NAD(P)-dependent oxidoreductase [Streptomyces sp. Je 1-4]UZQ37007.1 NAD(P)-dependent oxidoreductase [Streptomyces sp. Je 1-4] [Streptomyces sp. Je 1-4 4N24]UZQ44424.1 NAD(P)-dependent oxidoreductase [Streptomyces sp. Je 1-4] [Streptomyces sp. Je 1-4 4N24_ara]